ncbi:molybdopterin-dependent oxidoreductase alpha subunit [Mucilaginibacter sp. SG538B]|uniref:FdhF/YdeP family oxidoreductase n=1 Tax=Mucilaginibacter sp. SG538B TaxID=2587021 RepID=UPI00159D72C8|nr:FdhF/YdeP family oxidoreductase [Mucilaginibacter sp. SG538B]NVM66736.1 molybdopterin-dependent oxidoreductase alpha subunit [Mucilaginibacter sp. SG538B]
MEENEKLPAAEPPVKLLKLTSTGPKKWAAGIPAVLAALSDVVEEGIPFRGVRALLSMNQKGGFDCSSCAWPDPDDDRSPVGEYCENGAKALAEEATTKKVTAEFFAKNSVFDLAKLTDFEIGRLGRLTQPMFMPKGGTHYQPITWDDAFAKIAVHLNSLESPDQALFYTSGRTSNETSFLYQLFAKEFGTNNMPDCSNMCHETSGTALDPTIGIAKGTVKLEDFYHTDLIVIIGHNPGTNAPRMMSALETGKKNGAKILAINPLPEAGMMGFRNPQHLNGILGTGAQLADLYLPVKINTDMALLKAIELLLLKEEKNNPGQVLDHDFINKNTVGYEGFVHQFEKFKLADLAAEAGLHVADIEAAADLFARSKRIIFCWGMGLTQQPNGVEMLKEIVNILLMKGSIGKPGAGVCPVRGHSNVQGNRTMLINEKPTTEQLDRLRDVFGFEPPRKHGFDVVNAIKAMHDGRAKTFFGMGGNFLSAAPDTYYTAEGLRKLNLSVHVSTKLNRSHLVHGQEALILPTLSRSDLDIVNGEAQFISTENSMGVIQSSKGILKPISDQLINETHIVCRMAMATLRDRSVIDWNRYMNSYDDIRDVIEKCIPGFDNYNERVRQKGGFYLPNLPREGKFSSKADSTRASFTVTPLLYAHLADDEYMMATTRTHDQFNTTIYGLEDRYRGIHNERRVVFMNQKDIDRGGFVNGELVDLFNYDDGIERVTKLFIIVAYPIPERNTVTYFPETNVLVSINNTVGESNMPASKRVVIKIKKHVP